MTTLEHLQGAANQRAYSCHHPLFVDHAAIIGARGVNRFSTICGSIFHLAWKLHPNTPGIGPLEVCETLPRPAQRYDSVSLAVQMRNPRPNPIRLSLTLLRDNIELSCLDRTIAGTRRHFLALSTPDASAFEALRLIVEPADANAVDRTGLEITSALLYQSDPLTTLANRAALDKGTVTAVTASPHCYSLAYDALFADRRNESLSLLEIGLNVGAHERGEIDCAPSLEVWHEYFPHAQIFGLDIVDPSAIPLPSRVRVGRVDQGDPATIERAIADFGAAEFDIIIDDGSHVPTHQRLTFETLFPHLRPGGIYVVEDLHWQPWPERPTLPDLLAASNDGSHSGEYELFYGLIEGDQCEWRLLQPNDAQVAVFLKCIP